MRERAPKIRGTRDASSRHRTGWRVGKVLAVAGLLGIGLGAAGCAQVPVAPVFQIANESSHVVSDVRVRAATDAEAEWGENLLAADLGPGEAVSVDVAVGVWDVRCETRSGDILRYEDQPFEGSSHRLTIFDAVAEEEPEALGTVVEALDPDEAAFVEGCAATGEVSEAACRCLVVRARDAGIDLADAASLDAEAQAEALALCAEESDAR